MLTKAGLLALVMTIVALAADVSGKWTATFDTQIGQQNYTYTLKVAGDTVTGTASSDNGSSEITEGKLAGDTISFVENLKYQDMAIRVEYTGKIVDGEIQFTRKVGEFATEQLVAKRAKS